MNKILIKIENCILHEKLVSFLEYFNHFALV